MRFILACLLCLLSAPLRAQTAVMGPMTPYVDTVASGLQSQITPLTAWSTSMTTKLASVPAAGPGAGLCAQTIVPSNLVTSGGVTGTVGSCSLIVMCGTSAAYVVKQLNVGSGC